MSDETQSDPGSVAVDRAERGDGGSGADRLLEAQDLLRTLERQLSVAVLVTDVDGDSPVTIAATAILGRASARIAASGHDEPAALLDLARQVVLLCGRDEQWLLRYGLGMG